MRKLTRGVEIGSFRLFWMKKNWKNKPHPFWFFAKYSDDKTWTFQSMRFEIWNRCY